MNETRHYCTDQEIKQIVYFLRLFQPNELGFLLDVGKKWSIFDPDRIEKITVLFNNTFKTNQSVNIVQQTLTFFDRNPSLAFNNNVPINEVIDQQLNPFRSDCSVCGTDLRQIAASVHPVKMYCLKGRLTEAYVFSVTCSHLRTCHSEDRPISIYPNFIRRDSIEIWTSESLNSGDFVYLGGRYAFERALIEGYTCQLLGSPTSWNKVVDGWNLEAFNAGLEKKRSNWQLRLSLAFMKYKTIQFDLCVGNLSVNVPSAISSYDQWAWETLPDRLSSFVYLWSNHGSLMGACGSDCSRCLVVDGHQKCRRRVCRSKQAMVSTEEFQSLKIGCCRTPVRGSRYCELHEDEDLANDSASSLTERTKHVRSSSLLQQKWQRRTRVGLNATNCRTRKSKPDSYINRCSRSFGIIAGVTNCKIVITFSELFRSETLREILSLLFSTIRASAGCFPPTIVYDDGCHLAEYLQNHFDVDLAVTPASSLLKQTPFSIDRAHYKNHVGRWCREHMNPDKNRLLDGVNTEAAEQLFSWLKGYAAILSCIGWKRSASLLLILFHNKNLERKNIRPTHIFDTINKIPKVRNICLAHVADTTAILEFNQRAASMSTTAYDYPSKSIKSLASTDPASACGFSTPVASPVSASAKNLPINVSHSTQTLFQNRWTTQAQQIRDEADERQNLRMKRMKRNAKRWKR